MSQKAKKSSKKSLKDLICHIKVLYYNNDPILNGVNDVNMLYSALCDLDEIIGIYEVKDSIVKQIKFLLVNYSSEKSKFDDHMLHTVVFGPPGVGKTSIGECLANLWKALGLLVVSPKKKTKIDKISSFPILLFKKSNDKNSDREYELEIKMSQSTQTDDYDEYVDVTRQNSSKPDEKQNNYQKYITYTVGKHIEQRAPKISNDDLAIYYSNNDLEIYYNDKPTNVKCINIRNSIDDMLDKSKNIRRIELLIQGLDNILALHSTEYPKKKPLVREKITSAIKIVSRPDFVGQYIGHTCEKTQKLLTNTLEEGKVLFIDEAYSIVLDEKDSFGHEALNELNRFMSEHPQLVVIFAGYKDKMEDTLFKYQPGFKRRCTWVFEITDYSGEMLSSIFIKQLKQDGWKYTDPIENLSKFFQTNIDNFGAFGGDTLRFVLYCKLIYSELKFDCFDKLESKSITYNILTKAYEEMYKKNQPNNDDKAYMSMFA